MRKFTAVPMSTRDNNEKTGKLYKNTYQNILLLVINHHWGERSWNENFPAGSKSRNIYYNIKWFLCRRLTNSSFKWAKNLHYIYEKCSDNKNLSYDQHILRSFEWSHREICLKAASSLSAFSRIWTKTEDLE